MSSVSSGEAPESSSHDENSDGCEEGVTERDLPPLTDVRTFALHFFPEGYLTQREASHLQWYYVNYPPVTRAWEVERRLRSGREFCCHLGWEPEFIDECCWEGVFPMASHVCNKPVMLPKLHERRCLLLLDDLHVRRSTKKRAKKFLFSINEQWDEVVRRINVQHGYNWLFPPLAASFKEMHEANNTERFRAKLHSIELWSVEKGADGESVRSLAAGELGFTIGATYTSLTGFMQQDVPGAGTVQIATLATLLRSLGFLYVDFGMEMEYKVAFGARSVARRDYLQIQHRTRRIPRSLVLDAPVPAADILSPSPA